MPLIAGLGDAPGASNCETQGGTVTLPGLTSGAIGVSVTTTFCHECALAMGHLPSTGLPLPSGSTYQRDKHIKHTQASTAYPLQSVFSSPSTRQYDDYIVSASLAGSVEFDDRGRKNVIWAAGAQTGFEYRSGKLIQPHDAVKIVLSSDSARLHAYPQSSTTFSATRCCNCERPALH